MKQASKSYKPFRFPWAVELTQEHERIHWIEDEADLSEDVKQWQSTLNEVERNHVTQILRLFTQSDVEVGKVYYDKLIPVFANNEIRNMLGSFACREAIHQRAYALLNDTLGLPDTDFQAFLEYEEMAEKVDFMTDASTDTDEGIALTLAKAVFNEGVSLFASFAMLLNYQRFGKMLGMSTIVEWSLRDESLHVQGVSRMFREFGVINDEIRDRIADMARTVAGLEDRFIDLAYAMGPVEGLTPDEVKQYIRYITDRRMLQLGLKPVFNQTRNPLPWLEWVMNGADHSNFFEKRVTEYAVTSLTGDWGWEC